MFWLRQNLLDPLAQQYNRYIDGYTLSNLLQTKGGRQAGNDYISKVFRSQFHDIQQRYDSAVQSVRNPTYTQFLQDNLLRLVGFNAVQRLIAAYQAYPVLKAKLNFPGTLSHTFTQITNQGLFSGMLKGSVLSIAQYSLILFPSVYMANKSENKFATFLTSYTVLDALLYPVDSLKNILYSQTHNNLRLRNVLGQTTLANLYRGIVFKLAFNVPLVSAIYLSNQANSDVTSLLAWLATAALYPLNTMKVRSQLLPTRFSIGNQAGQSFRVGLYRGVVPFFLLNVLASWAIRPLWSQERLQQQRSSVKEEQYHTLGKRY